MTGADILDRFVSIVKKRSRMELAGLSRTSRVGELGLDSLALMETISELEEELDLLIPDEDLVRLDTVGAFVDRVAELVSMRAGRA
ncbi:MAG TPA: phosphopantetheine-binding protein [Polyangiaceae bacterium]|jgi:acyl carrier protein